MIRIKAVETFVSFVKDKVTGTWRYIMRVDNYSQLSADKVMDEASAHSGIARGAIKGAWDALGEVIKTWVTEGHSVAIPGLGSIRFAVNGKAVTNVNDVAKDMITTRKVVFTPSTEIKQVLKDTAISITCYDRNGNVVKRVQDESENETIDDGNGSNGSSGSNGSNGSSEGNGNASDVAAPTISGTTPFADTTSMTISAEAGASIHYTTDGSTPTSASTQYSSAVTLSATTTVKAIAIKDGVSSSVASKTFTKSDGNGGGNDSPDGVE